MARILIIDDDAVLLKTLTNRLENNGFEVVSASDGVEGMKRLKEDTPDLVMLDAVMPIMDGFDFLELMKNDPEVSGVPVLIISGKPKLKDTFLALGVEAFICKPFEDKEILDTINSLLKHRDDRG